MRVFYVLFGALAVWALVVVVFGKMDAGCRDGEVWVAKAGSARGYSGRCIKPENMK